jgi:hypothetical protein
MTKKKRLPKNGEKKLLQRKFQREATLRDLIIDAPTVIKSNIQMQRLLETYQPIVALVPTFTIQNRDGEGLHPRTNFLDFYEEKVKVIVEEENDWNNYYEYLVDFDVPWIVSFNDKNMAFISC